MSSNFPQTNHCSEWQAPLLNSTQVLLIDGEVKRMLQQHGDSLGAELKRLDDAMQVYITFKNHELLRGVNWDVKRGERVGLVGGFLT